jgi:dTDP-4-amino-4,6-dideoxygalactose transaminase
MVVTDNDSLADTIRTLRNHGSNAPYKHSIVGYNSRLDELQATILRIKLKHIDKFNAQRHQVAQLYNERLQHADLITPLESEQQTHVYHQYTIRSDQRELIRHRLADEGIASAVFYPIPLHQQEVYKEQYHGISMPAAENAAAKVLSLPIYPELSVQQVDRLCRCILDVT